MRALELTIKTIAIIILALVCAFVVLAFFTVKLEEASNVTDQITPSTPTTVDIAGIFGVMGDCSTGGPVTWYCRQPAPFHNEPCQSSGEDEFTGPSAGFDSKTDCIFGVTISETAFQGCKFRDSDYDKPCKCTCVPD